MIRSVDDIKPELEFSKRDLDNARETLRAISNIVSELETELQSVCDHPQSSLKNESIYHPGTYYDKASTTHWTVCTVCGAKSETWETVHSHYG